MTRPRLYLHLGTDKTGSTAIQRMLDASGDSLARHGLHFPVAGRKAWSHSDLRRPGGFDPRVPWQAVVDEVNASGLDGVVSYEGLYHNTPEQWQVLAPLLADFDCRAIIYLRRQSEMVCSGMAQRVRNHFKQRGLHLYSEEELAGIARCYTPVLDRLVEAFGEGHVCVRTYEKPAWRDGNLYLDFLDTLGITLDEEELAHTFTLPRRDPNPTLDVEAVELMTRLDRIGLAPGPRDRVVRILQRHSVRDRCTFVPDHVIEAVDARCAEDNARLARRWFDRDVLFQLPCAFHWRPVDPERLAAHCRAVETALAG